MPHPERSSGRYAGSPPADLLAHLERHLLEYGTQMSRTEERLELTWPGADLTLTTCPEGFTLEITAANAAHLHQAREGAMFLLDHVLPDCTATMIWSGTTPAPGAPPNFHLAHVVSVERFAASFLRVELDVEGIEALSTGGMHFSLLLPPEGKVPLWPVLDERGRTRWPEGPGTPHRAGYTFVSLDPDRQRIVFDVYMHEGGPTPEWARHARPGDIVAVMGPGGGDFPPGDFILLGGDETALPAIRRILETSAPGRRGVAMIEVGDRADTAAIDPAAIPAGITLRWFTRGGTVTLAEGLRTADLPAAGQSRFVWIAAEQALVREAKQWFRENHALGRAEGYFSSYWER
ncbi:siderophore-interacting protein [Sinirhodobacter populi]|uniref:Siderophore-interacting protein n=1 Tax=Paenirhodobacter populi TaxID=2306993 RepID=A0A443K4I1_9RHOB|nr:siderophore-interacting protein [Sinirhodobacter populi]RWR05395.1 siderophore-interacting protein [Sinirhodobacter populi]RWR27642.1 siderophore-interacting protein [Sinirhodobacter populi]